MLVEPAGYKTFNFKIVCKGFNKGNNLCHVSLLHYNFVIEVRGSYKLYCTIATMKKSSLVTMSVTLCLAESAKCS